MLIKSLFFGAQDIDPETTLHFPQGLIGLDDCRQFKLFHNLEQQHEPDSFWLQSLEEAAIMLPVVEARRFGLTYEMDLNEQEIEQLQLSQPEQASVLLVVYRSEPNAPAIIRRQGPQINANLVAPIILNLAARRGIQKVLEQPDYQVHIRDKTVINN